MEASSPPLEDSFLSHHRLCLFSPPPLRVATSRSRAPSMLFSLSQVPPPPSCSSCRSLARGGEEEHDSLTRLDLSSSRLLSTSTGLAVILEGADGGAEEVTEEVHAASLKGQSSYSVRTVVVSRSQYSDCVYLCVPVCTGVRTRSTFFVYCKSCSSVQPGKLRVRCRSCRQTTLTLSRVRAD